MGKKSKYQLFSWNDQKTFMRLHRDLSQSIFTFCDACTCKVHWMLTTSSLWRSQRVRPCVYGTKQRWIFFIKHQMFKCAQHAVTVLPSIPLSRWAVPEIGLGGARISITSTEIVSCPLPCSFLISFHSCISPKHSKQQKLQT